MKTFWDQLSDDGDCDDIVYRMQAIARLVDRQAYGMPRQEITEEIKAKLTIVKNTLETILRRLPK